jgi:uncharacterized protein YcfJ
MLLDLNFELLNLEGKAIEGALTGKLVAQRLSGGAGGDALKLIGWARKLYKGDAIELDASDAQTFRAFIDADQELTILTKAQVIEAMIEAKEAEAAEKKDAK